MRHVTMTCPTCGVVDKAVGDPSEDSHGHTGKFHCFNPDCPAADGEYVVVFRVDGKLMNETDRKTLAIVTGLIPETDEEAPE